MNCKPKLINKYGEELLLFHIDRFLIDYPAYAKKMADAVIFYAEEMTAIGPTKLQRRYYIRYSVADGIVRSLRAAKAVRHLHEPIRDEVCLDREQAERLAEYVLSRVQRA